MVAIISFIVKTKEDGGCGDAWTDPRGRGILTPGQARTRLQQMVAGVVRGRVDDEEMP